MNGKESRDFTKNIYSMTLKSLIRGLKKDAERDALGDIVRSDLINAEGDPKVKTQVFAGIITMSSIFPSIVPRILNEILDKIWENMAEEDDFYFFLHLYNYVLFNFRMLWKDKWEKNDFCFYLGVPARYYAYTTDDFLDIIEDGETSFIPYMKDFIYGGDIIYEFCEMGCDYRFINLFKRGLSFDNPEVKKIFIDALPRRFTEPEIKKSLKKEILDVFLSVPEKREELMRFLDLSNPAVIKAAPGIGSYLLKGSRPHKFGYLYPTVLSAIGEIDSQELPDELKILEKRLYEEMRSQTRDEMHLMEAVLESPRYREEAVVKIIDLAGLDIKKESVKKILENEELRKILFSQVPDAGERLSKEIENILIYRPNPRFLMDAIKLAKYIPKSKISIDIIVFLKSIAYKKPLNRHSARLSMSEDAQMEAIKTLWSINRDVDVIKFSCNSESKKVSSLALEILLKNMDWKDEGMKRAFLSGLTHASGNFISKRLVELLPLKDVNIGDMEDIGGMLSDENLFDRGFREMLAKMDIEDKEKSNLIILHFEHLTCTGSISLAFTLVKKKSLRKFSSEILRQVEGKIRTLKDTDNLRPEEFTREELIVKKLREEMCEENYSKLKSYIENPPEEEPEEKGLWRYDDGDFIADSMGRWN